MRPAPDIVLRVVFEMHFRGRDRVNRIQNRISEFSGARFHGVVAEGLSGIKKDRLLVFDRVELDVGEVCSSRLEDDLAAGIVRCLRRWALALKPSHSGSLQLSSNEIAGSEQDDVWPQTSGRQAQRGPASSITSAAGGLNAAVAAALQEPADWSEFLAAVRENHALRRRLADEVSPKLLRQLVAALVPDRGVWIADYAEEMVRLHERHPLLTVNIHVFRRVLWECIFSELAGRQNGSLDQQAFIYGVLRLMAARQSRSNSEIAANLALALQRHPSRTAVSELLVVVIAELKTQDVGESSSVFPRSQSQNQPLSFSATEQNDSTAAGSFRRLDDLAKFLALGVLPWSLIGRGAQAEMLDLLAATPDEVCALVRKLSEAEPVRKRLSSQFSEAATGRLLATLAPTAVHWMISYMRQLRQIHARKPLFPLRNRQFAQELWELCFEYLAQRKWQNFSAASFLQYLLTRLAARRRISYEVLLADVALRRGPESQGRGVRNTSELGASFGATLVALLDEAILGFTGSNAEVPRFLIKPEFRYRYSDLDVLAHWLRWRKLPGWSHATDPEDTGRRLGSLLRALPDEVQAYTKKSSSHSNTPTNGRNAKATAALSAAEQIEHWLTFGMWPHAIAIADSAQLEAWLEKQSDADWLKALDASGAQETVIARISHHSSLWERTTRLLAGNAAGLVLDYAGCLDAAGRRIAPVATQVWVAQLRKYTLMYLLRASSISGRHAISISDLARSAMLALALNCRLSYERLLDAVEHQGRGHDDVQNVCRTLRQELETEQSSIAVVEPTAVSTGEPDAVLPLDLPEVVLHYLKHGSLPENASTTSFSALQQAAKRLSDEQISNSALHEAPSVESARRIATLFSKENFIRFAHPSFTSPGMINQLEDAVVALASRFSAPSRPLLVIVRKFLLRHLPSGSIAALAENVMETVLSRSIPEVASLIDVRPELLWRELGLIAKGNDPLAKVLAGLERKGDFPQPQADYTRSAIGTQSGATSVSKIDQKAEQAAPGLAPNRKMAGGSSPDREHEHSSPAPELKTQAELGATGLSKTQEKVPALSNTNELPAHEQSSPEQIDCSASESRTDAASTDELRGKLAALAHFLRTGQLPWWTENLVRESSRDWIALSLARDPKLLLESLRPVSSLPGVLPRLMRYMAKGELEEIVRAAAPEYGGLLLLYIDAGSRLSETQDAALTSAQQARSSAVHWQQALAFLLDAHAPQMSSPGDALRELSGRVARSLDLAPDRYLACVLRVARRRRNEISGYAALAGMLEQLLPSTSSWDADETTQTSAAAELVADAQPVSSSMNPAETETAKSQGAVESSKSLPSQKTDAISSDSSKPAVVRNVVAAVMDENTGEATLSETVSELLPQSSPLQQLDCLLRYGKLPESQAKTAREHLEELTEQVIEALDKCPGEYSRYLLQAAGRELERKRMPRLLPVRLLSRLWPLLLPVHHATAALFLAVLEETLSVPEAGSIEKIGKIEKIGEGCREIIVEELLHAIAASQGRRWDSAAFLRPAIERVAGHLGLRPAVLVKRVRATVEGKPDELQKELQPALDRVELETASMPRLRPAHAAPPPLPTHPAKRKPAEPSRRMPEKEPFYIRNAGLVLLWPFLQTYFQKLELLEKNAFRDEHAQSRSIYLQQYLATGSIEAQEHELLLNKILAGAVPEQPVESPAPLVEAEEALSQQLLQGVLQNWSKMKNTSIPGLRESFLQREGKLLLKEDAWHLTVSTKGYDVLLDSLPWRLSLVRLPFMKNVLHVKWR